MRRGSRRATGPVDRRAGAAGRPGADLGDHRRGPRRELRRASRRLLPRDEPLPDRAPCPAVILPPAAATALGAGRQPDGEPPGPGGDGRRLRGSRDRLAFPGESLARFWDESPQAPADPAAAGRAFPKSSPMIRSSSRIDRNCSSRTGRWPLWPKAIGPISAAKETSMKSCFTCATTPRKGTTSPTTRPRRPRLEQMRDALSRLTAGPLTPQRFHP